MSESPSLQPGSIEHLGSFLRRHRREILGEWSALVHQLPTAHALSEPRLLEHIPDLLDAIALVLDESAALSDLPKVHAFDRLDLGFDLAAVIDEYALLRR
jgi:hypothetical protein